MFWKNAELPWKWTPKFLQKCKIRQAMITKMTGKKLKRKQNWPKFKKQVKKDATELLQNVYNEDELQIQFSQKIKTWNQAFIAQGPGNFNQFPEVSELCIYGDNGKNLEWRKISGKKRSRKWDCYIFYKWRSGNTGITRKDFGR